MASKDARTRISQTQAPRGIRLRKHNPKSMSGQPVNLSARAKASLVLFFILAASHACLAQAPCAGPCKSKPERRRLDFWVGEWDAQNLQGQHKDN